MRRSLSLIFLFGLIYTSKPFAQINNVSKGYCLDSLMHLRGYFVRVYKKSDIEEQERNRILRVSNRPFRIKIDGNAYDEFFLPMDSANIIELANDLTGLHVRDKEDAYLRCTSANYAIFNEHFCITGGRVKMDTCGNFSSNKYYSLKYTSKYCYQIFYISGKWLKATAEASTQKLLFPKQTKYINPEAKKINVYLLYKVDEYIPDDVKGPQLSLWKNIPAVME
ncbi:hypothetical protein [Chitinophaga japonensis]|uniref:Uncharacterized protein n=1 Tax=Chitinophaga japonensis TaxID=104662 RepID=A0A562T0J4_CHIJA|nr:hypothetical protein [Chitinophaga japonensis]TWI87041.1 hypothetical protein LX66_4310 [Chitinophaga japonensis]